MVLLTEEVGGLMQRVWRSAAVAIVVAVVTVLDAGCSTNKSTSSPPSNATASSTAAGTSSGGGSATTVRAPSKVLATIPLTLKKAPSVQVAINDLRRTSTGVVTMLFTLGNDGTGTVDREFAFSDSDDYNSFNLVYLLDEAGQKKYLTLQDSKKACVCSRDLSDESPGVAPGTRGQYFVKFPAPPDTVTSIEVVFPGGPPTTVPISK
ncbi:MAG: hypothetical protein M3Y36_01605 [Actinomycetota bacterium]|nr:hypothetical protein [Actinomycetota bacterium]